MATFTERLAYVITANAKDAIRAFREVRQSAQKDLGGTETAIAGFGANAKNFGSGLKAAGAGLLGVGGASAAFDVLNEGIDAASGLEQAVGGIEAVFGDAGKAIEDFAETAANSAGLSRREVFELAATMGAQLQGMGISAQDAADQVVVLQKRAADMAATFGGTTADAVLALSSSLRGEHERIERYGVSLRQSEVNARVAAMGLDTSTSAAKKNAIAMATLDIILDSTAKTQGQFGRESDSAAGSQARFNATLENLKATLGEGVLPVVAAFTDGLTLLTETAEKASKPVGGLSNVIRTIVKGTPGLGGLVQLSDAFSDTGDAAEEAAPPVEDTGDAIEEVGTKARRAARHVKTFSDRIKEAVDEAFEISDAESDIADAFDDLRDKANDVSESRADAARRHADAVQDAARAIRDAEEDLADAREDLNKQSHGDRTDLRRRVRDAEQRLADVHEDAAESVAETSEDLESWTPTLDEATRAGRENRDVIQEIVENAAEVAAKMAEQGAKSSEINGYLSTQRTRLEEIGTQLGFNLTDLQEYLSLLQNLANMAGPQTRTPGSADSLERQIQAGLLTPGTGMVIQNLNVWATDDAVAIGRAIVRELSLFGGRR